MECPKCGYEIDEKALVCPNCKKVLKLACPICKTINDSNTCKSCGYVIISKCHNCGKINQTISKKCEKGYYAVNYRNYVIGFVKSDGNTLKNKYPKAYRLKG